MRRWPRAAALGLGIAALGLLAYALISYPYDASSPAGPGIGRPAPPFALTDQHFRSLSLDDLAGEVVVLYFGYTHCPDTCPTTMLHMTRVKAQLGPVAQHVRFLFVTVDPARDTPERLRQFLKAYDEEFIGLWAEPDVLSAVWRDYGVYAHRERAAAFPDGYRVRHSWVSYIIDAAGYVRLVRALDNPPEAVAAALERLVYSSGAASRDTGMGASRDTGRTASKSALVGPGGDRSDASARTAGPATGPGVSLSPQAHAAAGPTVTVDLRDFRYVPAEVRIPRGTHVRFVNQEPVAHNIVQAPGEPAGFRSPQLMRYESWTYRFDEPGEYPILCTVGGHDRLGMTGTIVVE